MSKENLKEYFRHDYHARDHLKFKQMRMDLGLEGMGVYWCLIEMLYEEGGTINLCDCNAIAYDLHISEELLKKVISVYNLFEINEKSFSSKKVIERLTDRTKKSISASKSAKKKWKLFHAKAMRSQSERNAIIEENRIEENRRDNTKEVAVAPPAKSLDERKAEFYAKLVPYSGKYSKDVLRDFYDYWSESNENGKKMLCEMKKTFHIPGRLATWKKRESGFKRKTTTSNSGKLQ